MESSQSQPPPPVAPRRPTATEVRKKYLIHVAVTTALTIWFGYDGWYNPNIEAKGFNKVCTILFIGYLIFSLVMVGSAHRAIVREQQQSKTVPPPP
jgi:hypothetical protein